MGRPYLHIQVIHILHVKPLHKSVHCNIFNDHLVRRVLCSDFSSITKFLRSQSNVRIKMIESVNLPSIHTNGQFNKNSDVRISDSYRLKFPFHIKQVDPIINQSLLKDFTGIAFCLFSLFISRRNKSIKLEC